MKIVVIGGWAPSLIQFRGPLLEAMRARGHTVIAMAADGTPAITAQLARLGVEFVPLSLDRAGIDPRSDLRTLFELAQRLRTIAPDLVFTYTIKPVIYGGLAARIARVPRRAAMLTGLGYALTQPRTMRQRLVAPVARSLYRVGLSHYDTVFFHNPDDRVEVERRRLLSSRSRVEVVRGSGVDLDHYARAPLPDGPMTVLFIGRLLRDKGVRELVQAAQHVRAKHPEVRFRLLGWLDPNPESVSRAEVEAWVANGAVEYLGAAADVRPHLAAAHALVLPSYREGTPRSVLEAMSMGRAVITTDAPGCRETVVDDESGLLVPVGDAGALANAILRLIETPELLSRLADGGHARARRLYDARQVASQMLETMGL